MEWHMGGDSKFQDREVTPIKKRKKKKIRTIKAAWFWVCFFFFCSDSQN